MSEDDDFKQLDDWTPADYFTPEQYEAYERLPKWTLDQKNWVGPQGEREQNAYWCGTVKQWVQDAKNAQGKWKGTCRETLERVEYIEGSDTKFSGEQRLAFEPMDIAWTYVQEQTALLCTNLPHGEIVGLQESENQYIAATNQLIADELAANNFDEIAYDTVYDGQFFSLGWWKTSVDFDKYGPYGQKGKINVEKVEPEHMFVDPRSRNLDWDNCAYMIQKHEYEIGQIRVLYPITGSKVSDEENSSLYSGIADSNENDVVTSPVPKLGRSGAYRRQKIKVYEAWFHDTRLRFVAQREDRKYVDENGVEQEELNALALDSDGFVLGDWVPRYPAGRCIVCTESVILEDMPNRLPHGDAPFIVVRQIPSKRLFVPGDAVRITRVADKINDFMSRGHAYGQSEIERPMHAEVGCFQNAQYWKRIPNKSNKVIPLNPNKVLMRPPPTELPQFMFIMLEKYDRYLDMIAGSSAITRGAVSPEMQISTESMQQLQEAASARVALKGKLLAVSVKKLTRHMMWLIRRAYDENINVQIMLPDGTKSSFDWQSDRKVFEEGDEEAIANLVAKENFFVTIKAGTGEPNAKAAQQAVADKLYDRTCLTKAAYLDAYQYPNRQQIAEELENQEKTDIAAEALGRTVGLNVKKLEKMSGPGRREKSDG